MASKKDERTTSKGMVGDVKKHAADLVAILCYKIDRAARNLPDSVKLKVLESEYDISFISISQPTRNTPSGRMKRQTMANMAAPIIDRPTWDRIQFLLGDQVRRSHDLIYTGEFIRCGYCQ